MSQSLVEVGILLALIVANGVFAMSEAAVIAARRSRLQQWADAGDGRARAALALASQPNQFLATVQIGITLIGILAGAFGGATLAQGLAVRLDEIAIIAPHGEAVAVGLVVIVVTYASLVIGELVPKRIALARAERVAMVVAGPMGRMAAIATPIVRLLAVSTDTVLRLTRTSTIADASVTPEEIRILVEQGTGSGSIEEAEQDLIESALRLDDLPIDTLMTPRPSIVWLDIDDDDAAVRAKLAIGRHSRFPVARDSLDEVLGFVHAKDVLHHLLSGRQLDLRALLLEPLFVPAGVSVLRVLGLFRRSTRHLALVVDEHGGVQGMVTNNDLLLHVAGYESMAVDSLDRAVTRRSDGTLLVDGTLPLERLRDLTGLEVPSGDEVSGVRTIGGLAMAVLGAIPAVGQVFDWCGWRFEIVDMDGRRVDKVLLTAVGAADSRDDGMAATPAP